MRIRKTISYTDNSKHAQEIKIINIKTKQIGAFIKLKINHKQNNNNLKI